MLLIFCDFPCSDLSLSSYLILDIFLRSWLTECTRQRAVLTLAAKRGTLREHVEASIRAYSAGAKRRRLVGCKAVRRSVPHGMQITLLVLQIDPASIQAITYLIYSSLFIFFVRPRRRGHVSIALLQGRAHLGRTLLLLRMRRLNRPRHMLLLIRLWSIE